MNSATEATAEQFPSPQLFAEAAQRLSQLISVAMQVRGEKDTDIAGHLISAAAKKIGMDSLDFAGMSAETENGDRFYIYPKKIGSGERLPVAALLNGSNVIRVITGCYRGRMSDFKASVAAKYPSGTTAEDYAAFTNAAEACLSPRNTVKPLREAIAERQASVIANSAVPA